MNYPEGFRYMKKLVSELEQNEKASFSVGQLVIHYPGYKNIGDYKLTLNGIAPKHSDIVEEIFEITNSKNIEKIILALEAIYNHGLEIPPEIFSKTFVEKIYWITLQEEINYPPPKYKGRKLAFQRFYEGALAKVDKNLDIDTVKNRTNNHGGNIPKLLTIKEYSIPSFYK